MTKPFREITRLPEFENDLKKLSRKFPTLNDDLKILVANQLFLFHKLKIDNKGVYQIPGLGFSEPKVYKVKKFACRSLKGRGAQSGMRLIYAYHEIEDRIEIIEIYHKSQQKNETKARIMKYG